MGNEFCRELMARCDGCRLVCQVAGCVGGRRYGLGDWGALSKDLMQVDVASILVTRVGSSGGSGLSSAWKLVGSSSAREPEA